jgi:hypothetical protein
MEFKPLNVGEIDSKLDDFGKRIVMIHKNRILKQQSVNGGHFPSLKPSTVYNKQHNRLKSVASNANLRLIRTGDFYKNAFLFKREGFSLTFYISNLPYAFAKTFAKQEAFATRMQKSLKSRKGVKHSKGLKKSLGVNFTYEKLALWQLGDGSKFDIGKRSPKNKGANFLGLSKQDFDIETKRFLSGIKRTAEQNTINYIKNLASQVKFA